MTVPVPTREEYEKAVDDIHLEIGRAITEWSYIEQWLFDIYSRLVSPNVVSIGLSTSFNQVYSFDIKVAMVSRLVEYSGHPKADGQKRIKEWKPLSKKLKKLGQKRNKIAHGSIISPKFGVNEQPVALPVWVPYYDAHAYRTSKLIGDHIETQAFQELTAINISEIRKSFFDVQHPLAEFYETHFSKPRS